MFDTNFNVDVQAIVSLCVCKVCRGLSFIYALKQEEIANSNCSLLTTENLAFQIDHVAFAVWPNNRCPVDSEFIPDAHSVGWN